MTVYDRGYTNWDGVPTPPAWRFLVPARYALQDTFASRMFLAFFLLCFAWPIIGVVVIYLRYNAEALAMLDISLMDLLTIDSHTFREFFMIPQGTLALLLVMIVGPALVSPDLRNNALALYLSRPITRRDYIVGKLTVLMLLTGAVTWLPGALLWLFQAYLAAGDWWLQNLRGLFAMVVGFVVWSLVLSLLALALSSWVKWKPLARILFLGLIMTLTALGKATNLIYDTWAGGLFDVFSLRDAVWDSLFGFEASGVPAWAGWFGLIAISACALAALVRGLRAYEVVR